MYKPMCLLEAQFEGTFIVSGDLMVDAILGLDFIEHYHFVIDCATKVLKFQSVNLSVDLQHPDHTVRSQQARTVSHITAQKVLIPPDCEMHGGDG